ncbi:hypothetical protein EVAR_17331_1 [Eumeta japonica]|uniref:Uncharacterized protein n=1 Tax=Eumeta variegata TaxID=151549 RepID=A0A4C1TT82_EUMVA|nr:hypothetical protein EVAR_17331_1 [Eumeta japonica]
MARLLLESTLAPAIGCVNLKRSFCVALTSKSLQSRATPRNFVGVGARRRSFHLEAFRKFGVNVFVQFSTIGFSTDVDVFITLLTSNQACEPLEFRQSSQPMDTRDRGVTVAGLIDGKRISDGGRSGLMKRRGGWWREQHNCIRPQLSNEIPAAGGRSCHWLGFHGGAGYGRGDRHESTVLRNLLCTLFGEHLKTVGSHIGGILCLPSLRRNGRLFGITSILLGLPSQAKDELEIQNNFLEKKIFENRIL